MKILYFKLYLIQQGDKITTISFVTGVWRNGAQFCGRNRADRQTATFSR